MVMDGAIPDFKPTSRRFLDRADALVVTSNAPLAWHDLPTSLFHHKPRFHAPAPGYQSRELMQWIFTPAARSVRST
jgi:hypothetical protein